MKEPIRSVEVVLHVLLVCCGVRWWWRVNRRRVRQWWQRVKAQRVWQRQPKSPRDCPYCCGGVRLAAVQINPKVKPWREVKSRRGRKKRYATEGYACLNPACEYCGHTSERIHALVHHTHRGKDKDIPYLRCQACGIVFSSRKGTPLYYLKSKVAEVELVLWFPGRRGGLRGDGTVHRTPRCDHCAVAGADGSAQ